MSDRSPSRVGPKAAAHGRRAACSSQHQIVTEEMLATLRTGGTAIDAAIVGCLVSATVQQEMTNHAGTVTGLLWDARERELHELNGMGTTVPGHAPCEPAVGDLGVFGTPRPFAVIPGFMPALRVLFERFATRPWDELCAPAVRWAERGHVVGSFEHHVIASDLGFWLYSSSGREHFTPDGHLPQVGDRWPKPELAATLRGLASEGPDYFVNGDWAREFVRRGNQLGWHIGVEDMNVVPRLGRPLRYRFGDYEIAQLAPPERLAVFCSTVLGVLHELDVASFGTHVESAEALYYFAHAMRLADLDGGFLNDPDAFGDPSETLMSGEHHRVLAALLRDSRPTVDMTEHVRLAHPSGRVAASGLVPPHAGSCELSIVDEEGNWVQIMTTLQGGGIPAEVVGGVPMMGSQARPGLRNPLAGWFAGARRVRSVLGCTIVLSDGEPWLALGTPGAPYWSVPQVLWSILEHGTAPGAAVDAPRFVPMRDDYVLSAESRLSEDVVSGLARLGILVDARPRYDFGLGSFQMCWRSDDGGLGSISDPRRAGMAGAL